MTSAAADALLFDLGKVLLDWDPRYFYARFFPDDERALEHFCRSVVALEWIVQMDAGKPIDRAVVERQRLFPERTIFIDDWPLNVACARFAGLRALLFTSPAQLRSDPHRALGALESGQTCDIRPPRERNVNQPEGRVATSPQSSKQAIAARADQSLLGAATSGMRRVPGDCPPKLDGPARS